MADELLVSIQLRFPSLDRRALADHLTPVVREALAAGGNLTSSTVQPYDDDDGGAA